ncbi:MAG: metallophosphoesterase [Ferroplasma sp.]
MKEIQIIKDVFISDLYCVYLQDISAVVISDLHLGFEEEMNLHGLFLPRLQRDHVEKMVDQIIDRYSPEKIIINGDFKQEFSRNLPQEWDDINHFIDRYKNQSSLIYIRGNHDNYLVTILKSNGIELYDYYETGKYYIYHGDRDMGFKKLTILGHEHPSIVLRDRIGSMFKMPAFVYNDDQKILITPAMSFFSSGTDVAEALLNNEHFTPVLKHASKNFRAYGITEEFGVLDFGNVNDLAQ